jgi:hypothetical protein
VKRLAACVSIATGVLPAAAHAHAFGERYELPAPLSYFVVGAALTVALSFVVIAWATRSGFGAGAPAQFTFATGPWLPRLRRALQALAVAALLLVIVAGFIGHPHPGENIAPTWVWISWWVGLSLFCACIGNAWPALDPWRALFDAADALARRAGRARGAALNARWPARLGMWPAALLLLAFAWVEVVYPHASVPSRIAAFASAWTLVALAGMACFGRETWPRHADVFAIYFDLLGRCAPIGTSGDGRALVLRAPGSGLLAPPPAAPGLAAFAVAMLAAVLFDGLLGTQPWRWFERALGTDDEILSGTIGLALTWALLLAAYLLACHAAARLLRTRATSEVAHRFAPSLVPIAIGYHVAHNFSYFLEQVRWLVPLASDPLGRGWNLFGTADDPVVLGFVGARVSWLVAIGAIVIGHVLSIWVAHRIALAASADRTRAVLAGVPLTVLMVGYTALSLTIIAEPLVEYRAPEAALPVDLAAPALDQKRVGP